MTDCDDDNEILEIDFEVGHLSIIRAEPTTAHNPPRTHDWKVYLRSADVNGDLNCLIQRCVFYLHPEFPDSRREFKSTPFAIKESGYAGFHLPIDIFFKTRKEPKKFRIEYDLDLHTNVEGHPYRQKESYVRKYRCTFCNPDPEFRQKILAAGGKIKDTGLTLNNNSDNDESDAEEQKVSPAPLMSLPSLPPEPISRPSPPQKRSFSPAPTVNATNNKKLKVEQPSITNTKKKPQQSIIKNESSSKTTVNNTNNKKTQLLASIKQSSAAEEKPIKAVPIKDSSQTVLSTSSIQGSTDDTLLSKPRPSPKIKVEQDIKPPTQPSTNVPIKKKDPIPSPSKTTLQIPLKKSIVIPANKPSQKIPIKTEPMSTNKSPSNVPVKRESSPNVTSTNSTTSTNLISSLKKIPKKVALPPPPPPPVTINKRARSPMTPPPSHKSSDRDSSRRHQSSSSSSSKNQTSSKRDRSATTFSSSSSLNHSSSSRTSSSNNRSVKHSKINSNNRDRSRSRSRSRSHSHSRSSHQNYHSSRSNLSSSSSRHSSQQKDRSKCHTSPYSHPSSTSKLSSSSSSTSSSSSSHYQNRRTPTPSKSSRSPSRSTQSQNDHIPSSSNDISILPSTSINTPLSRSDSIEPSNAASTTCSPSTHVFQNEDDHTQAEMDIDGESDDDVNVRRQLLQSHEHNKKSPLSSTFVSNESRKILTNRNFQSDHSYSLSDTNESNDDSQLSTDDDDDDDDLPTVLTDNDLRKKLIYIYNRFTISSKSDLNTFVTFFKRHHLVDTSTKTTDGMFTYDLFSLDPLLIDELASDLGYISNSIINRTEQ